MKFADVGVEPTNLEALGSTYEKRVASAGKRLGSAVDAMKGFRRGMHLFGMSKGQFSALDVTAAVLSITGPAAVTVWTWAIADYEAEAVAGFMADGRVVSLKVVLDWSAARRNAQLVSELQRKFGLDCVRITKNHAKVVTVSTPSVDGWRVVIRGSCNLNFNPRFENFDVSDSADVFEVVAGLEREIWQRGKPMPVEKLRHADAVSLLNPEDVAAPSSPAWAESLTQKRWW